MIQLHRQIARVIGSMIIPIFLNELSIIRIITKLLLLSSIVSSRLGVIGRIRDAFCIEEGRTEQDC